MSTSAVISKCTRTMLCSPLQYCVVYFYNHFSLTGISNEAVSIIAVALKANHSLQTLK